MDPRDHVWITMTIDIQEQPENIKEFTKKRPRYEKFNSATWTEPLAIRTHHSQVEQEVNGAMKWLESTRKFLAES